MTKGWKTKVTWYYRTYERKDWIRFNIGVNEKKGSEVLTYWNYGTKKHVIAPKKGKAVAFPQASSDSGKGIYAKINHPGYKGRHKLEPIIKTTDKELTKELETALKKAAKLSGHMIK